MNILVALDNSKIKNKIKDKYGAKVYTHDISLKEDVIEYLKTSEINHVIITKLSLKGKMSQKEYVEKLRQINNSNKIIILVDKLKIEDKKLLFSNEIFNIIEGNEIDIDLIYNQIESKDKVIYKTVYKKEYLNKEKRKIAVFGTNGAGKSFISSAIAKSIAKYTQNEVLLLGFDILNPCIDIINNISCMKSNIYDVINSDKNITSYITKDEKLENLSYINSTSKIEDKKQLKVDVSMFIEKIVKKYNFLVIDLPASSLINEFEEVFKLVDELVFVLNPNYISIRQAKEFLNYICNKNNINKSKVKIIINKDSLGALDIRQIKAILKEYSCYISIKFFKEMDEYINGIKYKIPINSKDISNILNLLEIKYSKKYLDIVLERWNNNAKQYIVRK